ncbi:MAG: LysR substrate-binding domain-containing protein [Betaproteobacteria bacterium]|nr:LysR substrate-binding domain-containing protein [Betaproteobacteria bacterium]
MRHSTLRQLEVFEAIARLGSFTRAAEELFLTQPTVSMQIKKLTDAVGLPLFEQVGKKIYLTDAGRELHQACRGIFEHLANFEMAAADMKGLKKGKLRLAVVTTAKYFAPRLLGMFCQVYPGVDVFLKVSNRERVLERMENNQDDLYILGQPPEEADVFAQAFLENPLVVLAPTRHPLVLEKDISLQRIAKEPLLLREPGSGTRLAVERLFSSQGLQLNVRMELGSNEAIKQAIVGGLGISVLSRHTLALDAATGQLAELDVVGFPIKRQWFYAYPAGKQLSVIARTFVEYLQRAPESLQDLSCHYANTGDCPLLREGESVKPSGA